MAPFPEIRSKHSLVATHVTEAKWAKLGDHVTKTSGFTLAKAIACAVDFDNQHCGIYQIYLLVPLKSFKYLMFLTFLGQN